MPVEKETRINTPEVETSSEYAQILKPHEFLLALNEDISQAKEQIKIRTMHAEPGHSINLIFHQLKTAAKRGVNVQMQIDGFTEMIIDQKPTAYPMIDKAEKDYNQFLRNLQEKLFSELASEKSSQVYITNSATKFMKTLPMIGRDHRKIITIDGKVTYFGGINLSDHMFNRVEFMARIENTNIIHELDNFFDGKYPVDENHMIECNESNYLIQDSGKSNLNLIHKTTINYISNSQHRINMASQFPPGVHLINPVRRALERGVEVNFLATDANHNLLTKFVERPYRKVFGKAVGNINFVPPKTNLPVHVKLLIVDDKCALFGSHNIAIDILDRCKTAELSLLSKDPKIVEPLNQFFEETVK